jgi:hypothetical protein
VTTAEARKLAAIMFTDIVGLSVGAQAHPTISYYLTGRMEEAIASRRAFLKLSCVIVPLFLSAIADTR